MPRRSRAADVVGDTPQRDEKGCSHGAIAIVPFICKLWNRCTPNLAMEEQGRHVGSFCDDQCGGCM